MANALLDFIETCFVREAIVFQSLFLGRAPEDMEFTQQQLNDLTTDVERYTPWREPQAGRLKIAGGGDLSRQQAAYVLNVIVPEEMRELEGARALILNPPLRQSAQVFSIAKEGVELPEDGVVPESSHTAFSKVSRIVRNAKNPRSRQEIEKKFSRKAYFRAGRLLCRGIACILADAEAQAKGQEPGRNSPRTAYFQLSGKPAVKENLPNSRYGVIDLEEIIKDALGHDDLSSIPLFDGSKDSNKLLAEVRKGISNHNKSVKDYVAKVKGPEGWSGNVEQRFPEQYL